MERPVLYIFSKNQEILLSISRCVRHIGFECRKLKHWFDPKEHTCTYFFLEEITSILNKETPETLLNAVAIIDVTDVDNDISSSLNPIIDSNETGQIVSSLILAYPEVYWIILGTQYNLSTNSSDNESYLKEEHFVDATNMEGVIKLLQCHQDGYRPLFDPSGLRTWIKNNVAKKEKAEDVIKIFEKRTKQCAVTLDEEVPFAFLNSYVAYRFGYRCYMITSKAEMDKILTTDFCVNEFIPPLTTGKLCKVIPDDIFQKATNTIEWLNKLLRIPSFYDELNKKYPNSSFSENIMNLVGKTKEYRKKRFSDLENKEQVNIKRLNRLLLEEKYSQETPKFQQRVQLSFEDKDLRFYDMKEDDEADINDLNKRPEKYESLPDKDHRVIVTGVSLDEKEIFKYRIRKPYSGIFNLASKSGIDKEETHRQASQKIQETNINTHSAPNKILFIANILLDRARKVAKETNMCEDAVHAATLALEAKEILHGRSMTTALEAVSIQHQMEVRAECSFYGVAYEIDTSKRFEEIDNEVNETISISNKAESKLAQSYNAQLEIVNNIRLIFNEYEQFDEEETCLIEVRNLRRKLHKYSTLTSSNNCVLKKTTKWLYAVTIEKYFNWLIKTRHYIPLNIVLVTIIWILIFMVPYCFCTNLQWLDSTDFSLSEFKPPRTVRNLCKAINKDRYNIHLIKKRNTISRVNELLTVPIFYNILSTKNKITFHKNVMVLVEESKCYRKNTSFSNLSTDEQNNIKKLNRLLLEETYQNETPKKYRYSDRLNARFIWQCACQSALTFFEMQDAEIMECQKDWVFHTVLFSELIIAYIHLGIFITYLYQKLARR